MFQLIQSPASLNQSSYAWDARIPAVERGMLSLFCNIKPGSLSYVQTTEAIGGDSRQPGPIKHSSSQHLHKYNLL